MARWIGSNNPKGLNTKESGFNDRCKTNTQDLDDMIHYLEYRKYSGGQAARVSIEQEEHWAELIRDLLVGNIITRGHLIRNALLDIEGMTFQCNNCFTFSKIIYVNETNDFKIDDNCRCITNRLGDIKEYLVGYIEKIKKIKDDETDEE